MSSAALAVLAMAMLMAAAGAGLWATAAARQRRRRRDRFLDRHLLQGLRAAPQGVAAGEAAAVAAALAVARARGATVLAPDWMLGAASPRLLVAGAAAAGLAVLAAGSLQGRVPAAAAALACLAIGGFAVWRAVVRRRRALVEQLPAFLDAVVRLVTIGHSVPAAFHAAAAGTRAPLRVPLERALALSRAGLPLDAALRQAGDRVRVRELSLLAAMLGLALRFGGRADLLLERMAHFLRDTAQAEQELLALSADTRLSAWVLGLLPIVLGGAIVMFNAGYFTHLWDDPAGRRLLYGAAGLQLLGMALLQRLSRLA
jgi:tight adherence protein B